MAIRHLAAIGAAALALSVQPGQAGPCADAIEWMQADLDARIEAAIDTARFERDARRAFGLPEAKQGVLATTSGSYDNSSWMAQAVAALARARVADRNGDSVACEQALADMQRAIAR
jgi:hypothetical protein